MSDRVDLSEFVGGFVVEAEELITAANASLLELEAACAQGRSHPKAVRELCLAFPEAEEFESHGSPNFRARKGKVFAVWALNHHGDGHVGLCLNTPAMEQSRLITSSPHIYKPPYVGPSGWIGVELNRGFSWKRVRGSRTRA